LANFDVLLTIYFDLFLLAVPYPALWLHPTPLLPIDYCLNKFQFSEILRAVIIGLLSADGVPGDIMRVAEPVAALVEVGPKGLACQLFDLMMKEGAERNGQGE
jgi:hypothetical protein